MNASAAAPEPCPRCGAALRCGAGAATPCACTTVVLSDSLQAELRLRHAGCLCLACLRELAALDEQRGQSAA